jgi:hypothetical protein
MDSAIESINRALALNSVPNYINGYEMQFKETLSRFQDPGDRKQILATRDNTYAEIISIICKAYNLSFNDSDDLDYYSSAFYIYDFFVTDFRGTIVRFFANYILKEKNALYDALHLQNSKRDKDTSTLYNKKMYKNPKLAIINAKLDQVLNYICGFDISLSDIIQIAVPDRNAARFLDSVVYDNGNIFKDMIVARLNDYAGRPILMSDIRMLIHNYAIDESLNINDAMQ